MAEAQGVLGLTEEPLRVEFKVDVGGRRPAPKPAPGAKAERQRLDRAARRAQEPRLGLLNRRACPVRGGCGPGGRGQDVRSVAGDGQ